MRVTGRRRIAASGRGVGQDLGAAVHRDLDRGRGGRSDRVDRASVAWGAGLGCGGARPERGLAWTGVRRRTGWKTAVGQMDQDDRTTAVHKTLEFPNLLRLI